MPTTEMPSDDATDGVLTAAAGDAHAADDTLGRACHPVKKR